MQILRTLMWVVILAGLLAFSFFNWTPVEVQVWQNFVVETKVPALVVIAFLLGLIPMWLYHRGAKWSLNRRIRSLEASHRAAVAEREAQVAATEAKLAAAAPPRPAEAEPAPEDDPTLTADQQRIREEPRGAAEADPEKP